MSPSRGLVLAATFSMTLAACGSSGDDDRPATPLPNDAGTTASVISPSPTTGPTGSDPAAPVERSGFHGKIDELPVGLATEMTGATWNPGCPVPLDGLRLLHFNYWGFGGNVLRGPMVVNASVAEDVL